MAYFLVTFHYDQPLEKRDAVRPEHRDYLRELADRGALVAAGPMADEQSGTILYLADSLEQAQELLSNDPYVKHGAATPDGPHQWDVVIAADQFPA